MQTGEPTPFTPARKSPPPVPAVLPGPRPAPLPLPIPPLVPVPMPPPPPGPPELLTVAANGSPMFGRGGLATLRSGGPSSVGSMGNLGAGFFRLASGGVNWVKANLGARPLVGGVTERSPPPPPPPAFFAPAGSVVMYGEISSGVMSSLFLASVEGGRIWVN